MSGDLVAFLTARLDEDEAVAVAWGRGSWEAHGYDVWVPGTVMNPVLETSNAALAAHVARHDPARVLREVEAKRAILDAYLHGTEFGLAALEQAVCALATVYSGHPDYDPDWAPVRSPGS